MIESNLISTILFMLAPVVCGSVAVFAGFHFAKRKEEEIARRKPHSLYTQTSSQSHAEGAQEAAFEADGGREHLTPDVQGIAAKLESILASMEEARRLPPQIGLSAINRGTSTPVFRGVQGYWLGSNLNDAMENGGIQMMPTGAEFPLPKSKSVMLVDQGVLMQGIKQTVSEGVRVAMRSKSHRPARHHAKT